MRYIPVNCIKEGMIVAKSLFGRNGELYLRQGCQIKEPYMNKIAELGFTGIYIDDDLSRDIPIVQVINDDLRQKTVRTMKNVFIRAEAGKEPDAKDIQQIGKLLDQIVKDISSSPDVIVNMIDLKAFDDYTFLHSINVSVLSITIGAALNLGKAKLYQLGLSAIMHDIGKVFVPKQIVNKPKELERTEFETMKTHSRKGFEYLRDIFDLPVSTAIGVLQHHEKYDGSGYPGGTAGDDISLFGRIIAIADVYDALTSSRPYRKALSPSEAIEYIMGNGSKHFDPDIAKRFTQKIAPYPTGTCIRLSNNYIGIVCENYGDCCIRPKIKIIKHHDVAVKPYYIDLRSNLDFLNVTVLGFEEACVV